MAFSVTRDGGVQDDGGLLTRLDQSGLGRQQYDAWASRKRSTPGSTSGQASLKTYHGTPRRSKHPHQFFDGVAIK